MTINNAPASISSKVRAETDSRRSAEGDIGCEFLNRSQRAAFDALTQLGRAKLASLRMPELHVRPRAMPLLHGPTGAGKSFLAERVAAKLCATFYKVEIANWIPLGARYERYTTEEIRKAISGDDRVLLFVDEVDKLATDKRVTTVRELEQVGFGNFDLALVDLLLADGDSLPWIQDSAAAQPRGKVVVLTAHERDYLLHALLQTEVAGVVHKCEGVELFDLAMRTVLAGGSFRSPRVHEMRSRLRTDPKYFAKLLSERQLTVFQLMADGAGAREIGAMLGISEATAKQHRKVVMRKLDLHSQADVVNYAIERGFRDAGGKIGKSKRACRPR